MSDDPEGLSPAPDPALSGRPFPGRPDFSITEAAEACGVSRITMRRRVEAGRFPNAWKAEGGATPEWRIPLIDLLDAGFVPHKAKVVDDSAPPPVFAPGGVIPRPADDVLEQLEADKRRLEAVVRDLEKRLAVAEALADERQAVMADYRSMMRMLPAAPAPARRRAWWSRTPVPSQDDPRSV